VGPTIRRLRQRARLSLRAFADRVGFSPSFISQVENDAASPSLASLARITSALGVTLSDLFAAQEGDDLVIVKATARPSFRSTWSKARVDALIPPGQSRGLEALMVTLDPGGLTGREIEPSSVDQFVMVIRGVIMLHHNGHDVRLARGDSLTLPSGTPHRFQNRGRVSAQVLVVSVRR
jgi:transcriptional regulator with XRE-family HTH domain